MSRLRWTSKSSTKLADDLVGQGFEVSARSVLRLLHRLGYSLQANAKVNEGRQHPDCDAQFGYIHDRADAFVDDGQPVISVDTKKKVLLGNYANGGAEWAPTGEPERVEVHDFADRSLGEFSKAIPYGIYDIATTRDGSMSATAPIPPSSRWSRSDGGGTEWEETASPSPPVC